MVQDFHDKSMSSVQELETMRKLIVIKGYIRSTLDKLPGIREDLARLDDSWEDRGFCELVKTLRTSGHDYENLYSLDVLGVK